jgi:metallo-beta-lactamase class B
MFYRSLIVSLFAVSSTIALQSQAGDPIGYPTHPLPPIIVPWELGGAKYKLHTRDQDSTPFPAHRIVDNVYYVGQADYASYLITTPEGHILIDSTYESEVPLIQKSAEQLKFRFQDIKILMITHAHRDHSGGARRAKELTGAQLMVMDQDVSSVENGGQDMPPVKVDRVLHDRDEVRLGGVTIVAFRKPGHTPGNTTYVWKASQSGSAYSVVLAGSLSLNARTLSDPAIPTLVEDYRYTFRFLKSLPCDIYLGSHGKFFDLSEKYAELQTGGANPYIDPMGYQAHIKLMEQSFYYKLDAAHRQAAPR